MSENDDYNTAYQMGSIFAGLVAAGWTWNLLSPDVNQVALVFLSIFIFSVTAWGCYEAFAGYPASEEEEVFGEKAVSPTVSKMGLTDRDAWRSADIGNVKAPAPLVVGTPVITETKAPVAKKTVAKTTKSAKTVAKAPVKKAPAKKAVAKTAASKKAGPTRLKKPNGKADDLKLISGVGPKLEKTLNGLGFWHFAQIADWKKADVAIVDDELSFKGRIDRDDWIKQAKKLAKQKA